MLSIIPYDTEEEAIAIANDSTYGLAGGVWAGTDEKAFEVARKIRTGQVEINGGAFNVIAPFGGYKQSGIGRELGLAWFRRIPRSQGHPAQLTSRAPGACRYRLVTRR